MCSRAARDLFYRGFYLKNDQKISNFFLKKKFDFGLKKYEEKIKNKFNPVEGQKKVCSQRLDGVGW